MAGGLQVCGKDNPSIYMPSIFDIFQLESSSLTNLICSLFKLEFYRNIRLNHITYPKISQISRYLRIWDVVQPNILVPLYSTNEVKKKTFLLLTSHIKFSSGFFQPFFVNSFILIVSHFYNSKGSCSFRTFFPFCFFQIPTYFYHINQIVFKISLNQKNFLFQKRKSVYFPFLQF